jgi:hypothetical protein
LLVVGAVGTAPLYPRPVAVASLVAAVELHSEIRSTQSAAYKRSGGV